MSDQSPTTTKSLTTKQETTKQATVETATKAKKADLVSKAPVSLVAIFACFLAIMAIAGAGTLYWWQVQQNTKLALTVTQLSQSQQQNQANWQASLQQLQQQQSQTEQSIGQQWQLQQQRWQQSLQQLEQQVKQSQQVDQQQWALHQIGYQLQMAQRALILETSPKTSMLLLQQAEQQLTELSDARYLALTKAINQDITKLKLLPALTTEQTLLTLASLSNELSNLVFKQVQIPESSAVQQAQVTNSTDDIWQNLTAVWQSFSDMFLKVERHQVNVEPLMAPELKQNLLANMQSQLQLAQWAASQGNEAVFLQSLTRLNQWLTQYFDQANLLNQNFTAQIAQLKQAIIHVELPKQLDSLNLYQQSFAHPEVETKNKTINTAEPMPADNPTTEQASEQQEGTL